MGPAQGKGPSTPGRRAPAATALLVLGVLAGCSASNPWVTGAGGADDRQIQVAALDFITDHYVRELRFREPTVYCVGLRPTGRIQSGPDLLEVSQRADRWDPDGGVLRTLQTGHDREMRPLSECSWDAQAREVHRESGAPAVSFVAGPVGFETPLLARVTVEARESGYTGGRFACRVQQRGGGWAVDTCV